MNSWIVLTGQNILDEAWTTGDLYSIQPIVSALGTLATWVISVVGFAIVIFSIMKNALSGLYVINPQLWDKVDAVKQEITGGVSGTIRGATGGNATAQKLGGVLVFILSHIPNVKELTDFADENDISQINKKQYFAHAIPLLIAQIFIGMLIFQGYPAQIANWVGQGGTHIISAFLNNVDPVEFVEGVSENFVAYDLATDGSPEVFDKNINKMVTEMMPAIKTKYSDMLAEPAQNTAYYVESQLMSILESDPHIRGIVGASQGYEYSVSTSASSTMVADSNAFQLINGNSSARYAVATNGTYSIKVTLEGAQMPTGSTVQENFYFTWTLNCTPSAVTGVNTTSLIVFSGIQVNADNAATEYTGANNTGYRYFNLGAVKWGSDLSGGDISGKLGGAVSLSVINTDGTVAFSSNNATIQLKNINDSKNAELIVGLNQDEWTRMNQTLVGGSDAYIKIVPNGKWTKTFYNSTNEKITIDINEFRLTTTGAEVSSLSYAMTTWTDVNSQTIWGINVNQTNIDKAVVYTSSDNVNGQDKVRQIQ